MYNNNQPVKQQIEQKQVDLKNNPSNLSDLVNEIEKKVAILKEENMTKSTQYSIQEDESNKVSQNSSSSGKKLSKAQKKKLKKKGKKLEKEKNLVQEDQDQKYIEILDKFKEDILKLLKENIPNSIQNSDIASIFEQAKKCCEEILDVIEKNLKKNREEIEKYKKEIENHLNLAKKMSGAQVKGDENSAKDQEQSANEALKRYENALARAVCYKIREYIDSLFENNPNLKSLVFPFFQDNFKSGIVLKRSDKDQNKIEAAIYSLNSTGANRLIENETYSNKVNPFFKKFFSLSPYEVDLKSYIPNQDEEDKFKLKTLPQDVGVGFSKEDNSSQNSSEDNGNDDGTKINMKKYKFKTAAEKNNIVEKQKESREKNYAENLEKNNGKDYVDSIVVDTFGASQKYYRLFLLQLANEMKTSGKNISKLNCAKYVDKLMKEEALKDLPFVLPCKYAKGVNYLVHFYKEGDELKCKSVYLCVDDRKELAGVVAEDISSITVFDLVRSILNMNKMYMKFNKDIIKQGNFDFEKMLEDCKKDNTKFNSFVKELRGKRNQFYEYLSNTIYAKYLMSGKAYLKTNCYKFLEEVFNEFEDLKDLVFVYPLSDLVDVRHSCLIRFYKTGNKIDCKMINLEDYSEISSDLREVDMETLDDFIEKTFKIFNKAVMDSVGTNQSVPEQKKNENIIQEQERRFKKGYADYLKKNNGKAIFDSKAAKIFADGQKSYRMFLLQIFEEMKKLGKNISKSNCYKYINELFENKNLERLSFVMPYDDANDLNQIVKFYKEGKELKCETVYPFMERNIDRSLRAPADISKITVYDLVKAVSYMNKMYMKFNEDIIQQGNFDFEKMLKNCKKNKTKLNSFVKELIGKRRQLYEYLSNSIHAKHIMSNGACLKANCCEFLEEIFNEFKDLKDLVFAISRELSYGSTKNLLVRFYKSGNKINFESIDFEDFDVTKKDLSKIDIQSLGGFLEETFKIFNKAVMDSVGTNQPINEQKKNENIFQPEKLSFEKIYADYMKKTNGKGIFDSFVMDLYKKMKPYYDGFLKIMDREDIYAEKDCSKGIEEIFDKFKELEDIIFVVPRALALNKSIKLIFNKENESILGENYLVKFYKENGELKCKQISFETKKSESVLPSKISADTVYEFITMGHALTSMITENRTSDFGSTAASMYEGGRENYNLFLTLLDKEKKVSSKDISKFNCFNYVDDLFKKRGLKNLHFAMPYKNADDIKRIVKFYKKGDELKCENTYFDNYGIETKLADISSITVYDLVNSILYMNKMNLKFNKDIFQQKDFEEMLKDCKKNNMQFDAFVAQLCEKRKRLYDYISNNLTGKSIISDGESFNPECGVFLKEIFDEFEDLKDLVFAQTSLDVNDGTKKRYLVKFYKSDNKIHGTIFDFDNLNTEPVEMPRYNIGLIQYLTGTTVNISEGHKIKATEHFLEEEKNNKYNNTTENTASSSENAINNIEEANIMRSVKKYFERCLENAGGKLNSALFVRKIGDVVGREIEWYNKNKEPQSKGKLILEKTSQQLLEDFFEKNNDMDSILFIDKDNNEVIIIYKDSKNSSNLKAYQCNCSNSKKSEYDLSKVSGKKLLEMFSSTLDFFDKNSFNFLNQQEKVSHYAKEHNKGECCRCLFNEILLKNDGKVDINEVIFKLLDKFAPVYDNFSNNMEREKDKVGKEDIPVKNVIPILNDVFKNANGLQDFILVDEDRKELIVFYGTTSKIKFFTYNYSNPEMNSKASTKRKAINQLGRNDIYKIISKMVDNYKKHESEYTKKFGKSSSRFSNSKIESEVGDTFKAPGLIPNFQEKLHTDEPSHKKKCCLYMLKDHLKSIYELKTNGICTAEEINNFRKEGDKDFSSELYKKFIDIYESLEPAVEQHIKNVKNEEKTDYSKQEINSLIKDWFVRKQSKNILFFDRKDRKAYIIGANDQGTVFYCWVYDCAKNNVIGSNYTRLIKINVDFFQKIKECMEDMRKIYKEKYESNKINDKKTKPSIEEKKENEEKKEKHNTIHLDKEKQQKKGEPQKTSFLSEILKNKKKEEQVDNESDVVFSEVEKDPYSILDKKQEEQHEDHDKEKCDICFWDAYFREKKGAVDVEDLKEKVYERNEDVYKIIYDSVRGRKNFGDSLQKQLSKFFINRNKEGKSPGAIVLLHESRGEVEIIYKKKMYVSYIYSYLNDKISNHTSADSVETIGRKVFEKVKYIMEVVRQEEKNKKNKKNKKNNEDKIKNTYYIIQKMKDKDKDKNKNKKDTNNMNNIEQGTKNINKIKSINMDKIKSINMDKIKSININKIKSINNIIQRTKEKDINNINNINIESALDRHTSSWHNQKGCFFCSFNSYLKNNIGSLETSILCNKLYEEFGKEYEYIRRELNTGKSLDTIFHDLFDSYDDSLEEILFLDTNGNNILVVYEKGNAIYFYSYPYLNFKDVVSTKPLLIKNLDKAKLKEIVNEMHIMHDKLKNNLKNNYFNFLDKDKFSNFIATTQKADDNYNYKLMFRRLVEQYVKDKNGAAGASFQDFMRYVTNNYDDQGLLNYIFTSIKESDFNVALVGIATDYEEIKDSAKIKSKLQYGNFLNGFGTTKQKVDDEYMLKYRSYLEQYLVAKDGKPGVYITDFEKYVKEVIDDKDFSSCFSCVSKEDFIKMLKDIENTQHRVADSLKTKSKTQDGNLFGSEKAKQKEDDEYMSKFRSYLEQFLTTDINIKYVKVTDFEDYVREYIGDAKFAGRVDKVKFVNMLNDIENTQQSVADSLKNKSKIQDDNLFDDSGTTKQEKKQDSKEDVRKKENEDYMSIESPFFYWKDLCYWVEKYLETKDNKKDANFEDFKAYVKNNSKSLEFLNYIDDSDFDKVWGYYSANANDEFVDGLKAESKTQDDNFFEKGIFDSEKTKQKEDDEYMSKFCFLMELYLENKKNIKEIYFEDFKNYVNNNFDYPEFLNRVKESDFIYVLCYIVNVNPKFKDRLLTESKKVYDEYSLKLVSLWVKDYLINKNNMKDLSFEDFKKHVNKNFIYTQSLKKVTESDFIFAIVDANTYDIAKDSASIANVRDKYVGEIDKGAIDEREINEIDNCFEDLNRKIEDMIAVDITKEDETGYNEDTIDADNIKEAETNYIDYTINDAFKNEGETDYFNYDSSYEKK